MTPFDSTEKISQYTCMLHLHLVIFCAAFCINLWHEYSLKHSANNALINARLPLKSNLARRRVMFFAKLLGKKTRRSATNHE